jgi:phosphoribosyl 1,2-cyclic phosphodiesterase
MRPDAIVLTHAHPDHAWGLKKGAPCTVYATEETWHSLETFPVRVHTIVPLWAPLQIHGMVFEAFPVEHSIRAPAVGYRITAGPSAIFYAPDLVYIYEPQDALSGIRVYVGDGASLRRPIVRKRGESLVGHASVRTQLSWCRQAGVQRALITHCGSQIVGADSRTMNRTVRDMGLNLGVEARIAVDGLEVVLP